MQTDDQPLTLEDYELNLILMEESLNENELIMSRISQSRFADQAIVQEEMAKIQTRKKDLAWLHGQLKIVRALERAIRRNHAN